MYRIYLHNFDYCLPEVYSTLTDARNAGIATGFEFSIVDFQHLE